MEQQDVAGIVRDARPALSERAVSAGGSGALQLDTKAPRPRLTLEMIHEQGMPPGLLIWHAEVPEEVSQACALPARMTGPVDLGNEPAAYVAALFGSVDDLRPPGHYAFFQGLGDRLYEKTPLFFRQLYAGIIRSCIVSLSCRNFRRIVFSVFTRTVDHAPRQMSIPHWIDLFLRPPLRKPAVAARSPRQHAFRFAA
jgi:hypothetical protein